MNIERSNKLEFFQGLYTDAKNRLSDILEQFDKNLKQYKGDLEIDGSNERATTCRNITYELLESQFSSYLPPPAVTAEVYSERNERNAKSVERLLNKLRNKLPFEKMNDIDERYAVIYGGSIWLVEWDNSIKTHNTVGDVKISTWSPSHLVGQPNIYEIDDMEYCFITFETTREDLVRKYGVSFEETEDTESFDSGNDEETATVIVCYYKDEDDNICQYIWSGDVELSDIEDYYSRKRYVCKKCGKRKELCECEKPKYELLNDEYEELDNDIHLSDGSILPAMSSVIKNGEFVMETKQTQALMPDGSVALEDINGILIPQMTEIEVPKTEQTKLPYYTPKKFPIVIRRNTSQEDSLFGQSDCEFIRPQQQAVNKIESRILDKLIKAGVYPTVPDDFAGQFENGLYKTCIRVRKDNYQLFNKIDLEANISQDIAQSDRLYDQAKRILGITDSYVGQADYTATSGVAKQLQVNQAAGRLDSKRKMKNAAYAEIDEIIFQYYLAYSDEPRIVSYKDELGRMQNAKFNRYDFIERDMENGEYYYNSQYMFATDPVGNIETNRALLWQECRQNFQIGAFGRPELPETLLFFWKQLEKHHYPDARDMVERIRSQIQQQQLQQQQLQQQQLQGQLSAESPNEPNLEQITNGGY